MPDLDEKPYLDPADGGGPVKSFLEHLEDLRWVLVKSAAALAVAMLLCLVAGNYVMDALKWPLSRARISHPGTNQVVTVLFGTNEIKTFTLTAEQQRAYALGTNRFLTLEVEPLRIGSNQVIGWRTDGGPRAEAIAQQLHIDLINLSPAGGFVVAFQVALYGGMVMAAPFIFYFVMSFVFPALRIRERKYVFRGLFIGGGLFLLGVSFCYFALMPIALSASQLYSRWLGLGAFQWRAEEYISFVCKFMLGMGLGFELPVVILTLVKIGVIDYRALSKARRYMIVVNLFLGAILTTPEVLTQVVMFVPLQGLYEISVLIAWYWAQADKARARRRLAVVFGVIALVVAFGWIAYRQGWFHFR